LTESEALSSFYGQVPQWDHAQIDLVVAGDGAAQHFDGLAATVSLAYDHVIGTSLDLLVWTSNGEAAQPELEPAENEDAPDLRNS